MRLIRAACMFLLLSSVGAWQEGTAQSQRKGAGKVIEYTARPVQSDFVLGESVDMILAIRNMGTQAVQMPDPNLAASVQPQHWLSRPGANEPVRFTNHRLITDGPAPAPPPSSRSITIQPGSTWRAKISLNRVAGINKTGEYRLGSSLNWGGATIESPAVVFRVGPVDPVSIDLGLGERGLDIGEGGGAFLQRGQDSHRLYVFRYREMRPAIAEAKVNSPLFRTAVSRDASGVAVPWKNAPLFNERRTWTVWREGRSVQALASDGLAPIRFESASELAQIVRPPVTTTRGPVDVLLLSKDLASLELVRIVGDAFRPVWKAAVPAAPVEVAAAIGPEAAGSPRHIAFVAREGQGLVVFAAAYGNDSPAGPFRRAAVEASEAVRGSLSMFVDAGGTMLAGFVATRKSDVFFVEVVFPSAGGAPAEVQVTPLGSVEKELVRGATLYSGKQGELRRRDAVVETGGGMLLRMTPDGTLVRTRVPVRPTNPILLAPGQNVTYIFGCDAERGLYMEPL